MTKPCNTAPIILPIIIAPIIIMMGSGQATR